MWWLHVWSCTECKCNVGGQCGDTAADKTVKLPVIVTQAQNQQNPSNSTKQLEAVSRPSKYTRILAGKVFNRKAETTTETVRKMCPPPVPTTIQVIGTVKLNTISYQDFVQTFKSANQQNQWKVKKQWTSKISENNIFGETDILEVKWRLRISSKWNPIFDSKSSVSEKSTIFHLLWFLPILYILLFCASHVNFLSFRNFSGNCEFVLYLCIEEIVNYQEKWASMLI